MPTNHTGTGTGKKEDTRQQGPAATSGKQAETSSRGTAVTDRAERSDQERAIQTDREQGRSGGVARRQQWPLYGSRGQDSPFLMMQRMAEDMDRLFEQFGFGRGGFGLMPSMADSSSSALRGWSARDHGLWTPQVETFRRGDQLVVRADLPGLRKEDVKVEIDDGMLTISGERREEHEENRDDFYRSERTYGQFYRAVPLPDGVDENACNASFRDGVLEVTLPAPKQDQRRTRQIEIR